jgi:hypothetical protein
MRYIRRIHEVVVCSSVSQTTNLFFTTVIKIIIVKFLSKARFFSISFQQWSETATSDLQPKNVSIKQTNFEIFWRAAFVTLLDICIRENSHL